MKRSTKQKECLEQEIAAYTSFFNAEDLYQKLSKKNPTLGIATVYRFLNDLTRNGKIHTYSCNRKTLYSTSKKNHCHFTCEKCGQRKHITLQKLDFFHQLIPGDICHFQIDISGICEKCIKE